MAGFDIQGARSAGYSDDDVLNYIRSDRDLSGTFDIDGARKAGYSASDILNEMAGTGRSTGPLDAIQHGVSEGVIGVGKTLKNLGGTEVGPYLEKQGAALAPTNYDPAGPHVMKPQNGESRLPYIPRAALEGAPGFTMDMLGAGVGRAAGGAVLGPVGAVAGNILGGGGSYFMRNFGNEAESRARNRTGDANAVPSTEDKVIAGLGTAGEGALQSFGVSKALNPFKVTGVGLTGVGQSVAKLGTTAALEGGVGAAQAGIGELATKTGTKAPYDVDPLIGAGLTGAATGLVAGSKSSAKDATTSVRFRELGDMGDAPAKVAARIQEKAGDNLGNGKTDFQAVKDSAQDIRAEIGRVASDPEIKARIDADPDAANALKRAVSETKMDKEDAAALTRVSDGTARAPELHDLIKQSLSLDILQSKGFLAKGKFVGGLSGTAEAGIRALQNPTAAVTGAGLGLMGLGSGHAAMLLPYTAPALGAIGAGYAGLRALDKTLGLRSPSKTFVEKFGDGSGVKRVAAAVPAVLPHTPVSPTGPKLGLVQPWSTPPAAQQTQQATALLTQLAQQAKVMQMQQRVQQKQQQAQNRQTSAQAMPLIAQLAAQSRPKPPAPAAPSEADQLQTTIKQTKPLVAGLYNIEKLREQTLAADRAQQGQAQAEGIARVSPLVQDAGGLDQLSNPAFGKRAGEIISAAAAMKKLTAEPESEASVAAKPARKANGKANGAAHTEQPKASAHVDEAPIHETLKHTKINEQDRKVAAQAAEEFKKSGDHPKIVVERYRASTERRQARIRDRLMQMSGDEAFPADNVELGDLLTKVATVRRRDQLASFVDDISEAHPDAAATVRRFLGPKWAKTVWNKK